MSSFVTFAASLQDRGITELHVSLYVDPKTNLRMMKVRPVGAIRLTREFDLGGDDPLFTELLMALSEANFSDKKLKEITAAYPKYAKELEEYSAALSAPEALEEEPTEKEKQELEKSVSRSMERIEHMMRGMTLARKADARNSVPPGNPSDSTD